MESKDKELGGLKFVNRENTEQAPFLKKYIGLCLIILLIAMIYVARLWQLQVLQGKSYRLESENNYIRVEQIAAPRGMIFDRNGVLVVENRPAFDLAIMREDISDLDGTVRELARLCNRDPDEFFSIIKANQATASFLPLRLVSDLDRDSLARIEAQRIRLPGVMIQLEPKRKYKWNGEAAHLIGYLSEITESELKSEKYSGYYPGEDIGKVGIEGVFEMYLHGIRGEQEIEVDATGRSVQLLEENPPVAGHNLFLTLDMDLQKIAESLLEGKTGAIVAVDPTDGAILAFASSPTFDQEKFIRGLTRDEWLALSKDPTHPLLNRVSGAAYPPGSTYKPFVALAALQEGAIAATTTFNCPGYFHFADRIYHCWKKLGHGTIAVERAIIQSCDVFFYQTGLKLGVDRLAQYVTMFGLGERTGIGLPGEIPGLVPTSRWKKLATGIPWQKGETISISIGQGFDLATPLQMAMGYAAIGNSGKLWQPYVVKRIEGGSENEMEEIKPKLGRKIPIDQRWFDLVKKALSDVVESPSGTGHLIRDPAVPIAGKTGTAQVVNVAQGVNGKLLERLTKTRDHAWFVGYAPASDPKICVAAIVEHGGHGASAAAPLVRKVILAYLKNTEKSAGQ
jgi:penicillin-binding protein 2